MAGFAAVTATERLADIDGRLAEMRERKAAGEEPVEGTWLEGFAELGAQRTDAALAVLEAAVAAVALRVDDLRRLVNAEGENAGLEMPMVAMFGRDLDEAVGGLAGLVEAAQEERKEAQG
jgi:hypothetical protein